MSLPEKVKRKLQNLPDRPGCYMMRDRRGRIIYVGKASSLRKRVQSYFRHAVLRSASPKLRGLIRSIHDLDCIVVRTEAEAVLTEAGRPEVIVKPPLKSGLLARILRLNS